MIAKKRYKLDAGFRAALLSFDLCCCELETLSANVTDRRSQHNGNIQGLFSFVACRVQGLLKGIFICFSFGFMFAQLCLACFWIIQLWICLYMNFNYSLQGFALGLLCHPCDVVAVLVDLLGLCFRKSLGGYGGKAETLSVIQGFKYFYHFLKPLLRQSLSNPDEILNQSQTNP